MNETLNVLNNRISLRRYKDKPISEDHLEQILYSTMRAPTAGNMMLYTVLVIKDQEKIEKLSKSCDNQPFIAKAPLVLIFLADMQRWTDYLQHCDIKKFCKEKEMEYHGPTNGDLFLSISDALIAAQNAVIAAESLNIGSCYIGDIMENYEIHKEMLNLPDKVFPIGMLTLGYYPDGMDKTTKPRFGKEYIVFEEEYKRLSGEDFDNMFQHISKNFNPNNAFDAKNIGQIAYSRKFGSDFAKEMERSVNIMIKHWNK
ncbi:nitroreductase family protein [Clostridium sp. D2Q-11]|uniref:Nitroreductase family protein n=1 Tax=Anaeromonas frigoriresistens TaxID=2683708 RepID=A0A942V2A5_9FIRM|nr:nitroreductase family protein [Anaeromonas frigoriresistens]MBS4538682.1 nitroreductase family protein [Anaeromonas frigoriresistens]